MPRNSRKTNQKLLIDKQMRTFSGFFSAHDLFGRVHEHDATIGLATVYRFLKDLREAGKLYSYDCDNRQLYSTTKKSHCHFICEETGEIIHFDVNSLDFLKDKIPGTITSFQIEVRGVCKKCD
ncbi:transcriptional repressor [Candidatus Woesearchaeota archaeon]|nr:transcriptional repressor [Candidatus Woesearchaeota archaeon]